MNSLEIIDQRKVLGKDFRIYGDFDNPLFLAKDVAEWIEYDVSSVNKMLNNVDENEKTTRKIIPIGSNYQTEAWFLTEDGLYEVLMQSRKPIAKQWKQKVKEILKSVRKHGAYMTDHTLDQMISSPEFGIRLLTELQKEREEKQQLQSTIHQKDQLIGELKPKADYTDWILQNKALVTVNQIAKDYGMSAYAMNKLLHELGVQYKESGQWLLYRKYHDKGYTHSNTVNIKHNDGREDTKMFTKWTQKGRLFIYELLKTKKGILPIIEQGKSA